jgi:hypothetical protein
VRVAACLVVGGVLALVGAGVAWADADPASDMLYQGVLFLPYKAKVSPEVEKKLLEAIAGSKKAGKEVRVALIADKGDLGGVPQVFGNPTYYARFLDAELQFVYTGRVLVVMPQGAALADHGRLVANKDVLAAKPGSGGDGLAKTATELVLAVSGARPAPVTGPTPTQPTPVQTGTPGTATVFNSSAPAKSSGFPAGLAAGIAIGVVGVLLALSAVVLALRRRSA